MKQMFQAMPTVFKSTLSKSLPHVEVERRLREGREDEHLKQIEVRRRLHETPTWMMLA
jgi:hypothetical protein